MKYIILALMLAATSGCNPFNDDKETVIERRDSNTGGTSNATNDERVEELEQKLEFEKEKREAWDKLVEEAREDFQTIFPIVKKKCFACHDNDTPVPWYGKPFRRRNIVYKHWKEGRAAFDMSLRFPIQAKGNPSQIALLESMKAAIVDKTMPLKIYLVFYPFRRITKKDRKALLGWIDPLIEKLKDFDTKYADPDQDDSPQGVAGRILKRSCFQCHANGSSFGGIGGDWEDLDKLANSEFVDLDNPEESWLYKSVKEGYDNRMPPGSRPKLTPEEEQALLDWISAKAAER